MIKSFYRYKYYSTRNIIVIFLNLNFTYGRNRIVSKLILSFLTPDQVLFACICISRAHSSQLTSQIIDKRLEDPPQANLHRRIERSLTRSRSVMRFLMPCGLFIVIKLANELYGKKHPQIWNSVWSAKNLSRR
jgi:hypothetical protein